MSNEVRKMDWQTFYDRFFDWASSTQIQRARQLTSLGPSDQVVEVAQELMDEKSASRFTRRALEAGVSFTAENIEDLWSVCDKETINVMLKKSREHFTQEQLENLWGMADDEVVNRVEKKKRVRLFDEPEDGDPEAEDIDIPQEEYPKKPSFWQSLGLASLLFGSKNRNTSRKCNGDCAHCPPHYGYRYGRWYYGHGYTHGCEFGGNHGDGRD